MDIMTIIGILLAVFGIVGLAIFTGAKKKAGKKEGINCVVAAGLIMGTLVGGSSTVGTAQLAYNYGMSAWWFTLGASIGCLVLALGFVKPMRAQGVPTLAGMISKEYGPKAGLAATILNSLGTFISILSNIIAASAVILVVWPTMGTAATIALSALVMVLYVVFGGAKGAGIVGVLKLVLLYVSMIICGLLALNLIGGFDGLGSAIASIKEETGRNFANLFCRGFGTDIGAGLSLVLGVLCTQTYAQAVISSKNDKHARLGALISTCMIPPIGIFGILVGLYMRTVTDPAAFVAKTALTSFVLDYSGMPGLIAGIVLGTLFIASVGTGSGLALGIATVINRELIQKKNLLPKLSVDNMNKLLIVLVLALATALGCTPIGDTILRFAFMSMGLRGCTVFAPMVFLFWAKGKVSSNYAFGSIVAGCLVALILGVLDLVEVIALPCDAVIPGIIVGLVVMFIGYAKGKKDAPKLA